MQQKTRSTSVVDLSGGQNTSPNFFALAANQTPNCMDVKHSIGGVIEKRLGSTTTNSVALQGTSGWGSFDFGANQIRWHVVAAGTGIHASSNGGTAYVAIATDRSQYYQTFERSRNFLIACSDTYNRVLYWAGSVGTFMLGMPLGSAPAAKYPLNFAGFLLLMNHSGGGRIIAYSDDTLIATDPWTNTFTVEGADDDEITGGLRYGRSAYVFTRASVNQVSHVGGNPDFSVRQIRNWGAVPGTFAKVTYKEVGEVIIALGWDRKIRIFDGNEDQVLSTPIEEDNGIAEAFLNAIDPTAVGNCRAVVDTEEQVYRLFAPIGVGSTQTTHAICLNLRTGAWYPYANQTFQTAVMSESANVRRLLAVNRTGRVHWLNTSNTDMGTAIDEFYESPLLHGATPRTVTKSHKLTFYFAPTSSGTLHLQDRTDFSSTYSGVRVRIPMTDTTSRTLVEQTIDIPVTYNVYQWRISSSASTATPWKLVRAEVEGSPQGLGAV